MLIWLFSDILGWLKQFKAGSTLCYISGWTRPAALKIPKLWPENPLFWTCGDCAPGPTKLLKKAFASLVSWGTLLNSLAYWAAMRLERFCWTMVSRCSLLKGAKACFLLQLEGEKADFFFGEYVGLWILRSLLVLKRCYRFSGACWFLLFLLALLLAIGLCFLS